MHPHPDKNLTLSTSVPSFLNFQQRANPLKYYNQPPETNQYQGGSRKYGQPSSGVKNLNTSLPSNLPLKTNQSFENQRYGVTHSQICTEPNQPYKFQFKRNTLNSSRPTTKEQANNEQQRSNGGSFQIAPNNSYPQVGSLSVNQENVNNFMLKINSDSRSQQLQKKVKDLESQLKFEEKYANDLFRALQQAKRQISALKEEKVRESERLDSLQKKNEELTLSLNEYKDKYDKQIEENEGLNIEIYNKYERIQFLESTVESYQKEIEALDQKIGSFGVIYRNQLYQDQIKKLKEQIISVNSQLAESILQKNHLIEEIKIKNEKMLCMTIDSPLKAKQPLIKSINISQKANEAISSAFEEAIRAYQDDIKNLKEQLQMKSDDIKRLEDEVSEQRKEVERLKQQQKIDSLRHNSEKNQILQEKDTKVTEKTNEVKTLSNRLNMIEERYNKALKQIKEKDTFLQEHLVGRTKDLQLRQYIQTVMQSYVQTFESRCSLEQKVNSLQKELQLLKK